MPRDFFDPTPEEQNVILVDAATLRESEKLIEFWSNAIPRVPRFRSTMFSTALPAPIRA